LVKFYFLMCAGSVVLDIFATTAVVFLKFHCLLDQYK
jgi:hypothetical protein